MWTGTETNCFLFQRIIWPLPSNGKLKGKPFWVMAGAKGNCIQSDNSYSGVPGKIQHCPSKNKERRRELIFIHS